MISEANNMLKEKVIIVTGAGRGIGKEMAFTFAKAGAIVYANDFDNQLVESLRDELDSNETTLTIKPICFDVCDEKAVKEAIMAIKRAEGHIDGLVNNAAVEFNELIGMISADNMRKMFEVNVFGVINMLQMTSRIMQRQSTGGSIVNIASLTAMKGSRGQLVYSATKGAVISITRSAAKELSEKGIRVNAIAPGLTNTAMMQKADPEKIQSRIDNICMGRVAEPEDIAKACLFMLSDLAGYVSGQVLAVDGCTIM